VSTSTIYDAVGRMPAWLIENILASKFIVDVGVVQATDQTTVDVQHAIIPQKFGQTLQPTVTKRVEVLWPFPGTWQIATGDVVLLLGGKDFVKTAAGATPTTTDIPWHYTQETLKAVPLYSASKQAQIVIDAANLFHVKNAAASLFTVINNLLSALSTFAVSCEAGPTGLAAAATTLAGALTPVTTALAQILAA